MSAAERSLALRQLPEDTVASARAAVDALNGTDAQVGASNAAPLSITYTSVRIVSPFLTWLPPTVVVGKTWALSHILLGRRPACVTAVWCSFAMSVRCQWQSGRLLLVRQALVRALEEAAEAAGLRLKPLDRKAEKAALASQRAALKTQLQGEQDPAAALSLAVPLLVMQVRGEKWAYMPLVAACALSTMQQCWMR